MKFTVQRNELLSALSITGKAIGKSVIPILENYRVYYKDSICLVTGSNLENFITTPLKIESDIADFDICINSNKLLQLIKALADQPLIFNINEANTKIVWSSGSCEMPIENGQDYPLTPKVTVEMSYSVPGQLFIDAIDKTLFSIDPNIVKEGFRQCLISFGNGISLVGCNVRILAANKVFDNTINRKDALLSKTSLEALKSINPRGEIEISYTDSNVLFSMKDGSTLTCQLVDEKYPEWEPIIPKDNNKICVADSDQLSNAIKRICIFSDWVIFDFKDSVLTLFGENEDYQESANEKLDCDYTGSDFKIKLVGNQILDIISKIKSETIELSFSEKNKPCVVKPLINEGDKTLFLSMPIYMGD